jgi:mannose-6-phosphate isomerase
MAGTATQTALELRDLRASALRAPLRLLPNRIQRFYRGGYQLDRYLGVPDPTDDNWSEEWLGNSTPPGIAASGGDGLARAVLIDGSSATLEELAATEPEALYGEEHVSRYGRSPGILLKYLDVGSHIPVHVHPTRPFAKQHLSSDFGKNEAWLVLGAREIDGVPARVWVGWREPVDRQRLRGWIEAQNVAAMRAAMHEIEVRVDDVLFIPAGTVHSLGEGVFAMEPQEPTDFAVFAEHGTYALGEETATNGLGWDIALEMFSYDVLSEHEVATRIRCAPVPERSDPGGRDTRLVSDEACRYFELNEITVSDVFTVVPDGRYAIDCIRSGYGTFRGPWGEQYARRGETYVVPASLGEYEIRNEGREPMRILRGRPPR